MSVVTYEHRHEDPAPDRRSYDRALTAIATQLAGLGWVEALVVCGSYAKGSLVPGWSDLDLVAIYAGSLTAERVASIGLTGAGRANPGVPVGIDFVSADRLQSTRRIVGRPLAMTLELRATTHPIFGSNPFATIPGAPDDMASIRLESEMLVRADANSWLRRAVAGHPSSRNRLFDATKTLLRIAMFESSPLPKAGFTVADYCGAVRAATPTPEITRALSLAQELRQKWGQGDAAPASTLETLETALFHYCEHWVPPW